MIKDDDRHIPVKLYFSDPRPRYAEGGLVHAAEAVRGAGRFGDEMVIHVNRREFDELRQKWGDPHINPDTGLPEFWDLGDLWDDVKDYVAPIGAAAAGAFLPGIGQAVGGFLPGLAGFLGPTGTQALATGLLGAGTGALINGGKGALYGGLGGVLGSYGGDFFRNGEASALGAALEAAGKGDGLLGEAASNVFGEDAAGSITGGMSSNKAIGPAILAAALNLGGNALSSSGDDNKVAEGNFKRQKRRFDEPLPTWENKRRRIYYGVPDYTTGGEQNYFENNGFAEGGYVANKTGDHGRSDKIEALLSPNEYVIDAETVSLLGNGSPEAGAEQLDRLRENIRRHKGSALAAGAISPDALPADAYME